MFLRNHDHGRMKSLLSLLLLLAPLLTGCGADEPLVQPRPVEGASPFRYPVALWDQGVQGETVLLVRVDEEGAVDSLEVFQSSGREAFDSAAVVGARRLRFLPAHRGERRFAMGVKLPVRFSRDTTEALSPSSPVP
jgi:TonB family protein